VRALGRALAVATVGLLAFYLATLANSLWLRDRAGLALGVE